MAMIRHPIASGRFYPGTAESLRALIESFVDKVEDKIDAAGIISPHAGYIYSGGVAGSVIARIEPADTYILIGPNHTGMGKPFSIMTVGSWETPLGEVPIDSALAQNILATSKYLQEDRTAHQGEHSIEVQLPLLQYFKPDLKIVPIVLAVATLEVYREIAGSIAQSIKESPDKKIVIVASSDMSHYEPHETAAAKDKRAIEANSADGRGCSTRKGRQGTHLDVRLRSGGDHAGRRQGTRRYKCTTGALPDVRRRFRGLLLCSRLRRASSSPATRCRLWSNWPRKPSRPTSGSIASLNRRRNSYQK